MPTVFGLRFITLSLHRFLARLSVVVISENVTRHVDIIQHGCFSDTAQHSGEENAILDSDSCEGG